MLASDDPTTHLRAVSGNSQAKKNRDRNNAWKVAGDLPASFRYAAQGLAYGFVSQRNFRIHVFIGTFAFGLGLWLNLSLDRLACWS